MGAYTLLQDLTVATNSTSVVLNDFGTITKDDFVKFVITISNPQSSDTNVALFANTATTQSNYHTQSLAAFGTGTGAARTNTNVVSETEKNTNPSFVFGYLKLSENDRLNIFANNNKRSNADVITEFRYITSSGATFASGITSLTFTGSVANSIGTGSRIQIYKLAAEKVADITVASNTTQVDISNLSIDKDSEYLLVSDMIESSSLSNFYNLYANNDTTDSNYNRQFIEGNGSGTNRGRGALPEFISLPGATRGLAHTHVKLANIGAYTFQSYIIKSYGTSNLSLNNVFASSTAENITSINQLNINSFRTNGIGAGSRFILYKLYE